MLGFAQDVVAVADKTTAPADELVAPFLLVPFRWLDKLFSGGRVTAAFHLEKKADPSTRPPRS
jgi:hypothetical protein